MGHGSVILPSVRGHIRSDNGPEFAEAVQDWLGAVGARQTAHTTRAASRPWENRFIESFNSHLRAELRRRDLRHYNAVRPHAAIGYQAPAPEVFVPALAAWCHDPP